MNIETRNRKDINIKLFFSIDQYRSERLVQIVKASFSSEEAQRTKRAARAEINNNNNNTAAASA